MIKILSFIKTASLYALASGCMHPESKADTSPSPEFSAILAACIAHVKDDPIFAALSEQFGVVKSCTREQDLDDGVDYGEILSVAWDGADFLREERPPETTIIEIRFRPSAAITREWLSVNKDRLIPAALGIDWTNDLADDPNIEQYESSDPSFNGVIEIIGSAEKQITSFRLSYAL